MIILVWQSVTMQVRRLFWHISYYIVRQSNFIAKCDRLLLHSVTVITKWDVTLDILYLLSLILDFLFM